MPFDYYKNIEQIDLTQGQTRAQVYKREDLTSMDTIYGYMQNPIYGQSDFDRVELHVYDINKNLLFSDHKVTDWSIGTDLEGMPEINLDVNNDITKLGFDSGVYDIVYNFHRDAVGAPVGPKFRIHSISKDRTEVRVIPSVAEDDDVNAGALLETFFSRLQRLKVTSAVTGPYTHAAIPNNPLWTSLQLNLAFNRILAVSAWLIDDIFPADDDTPNTILLKLYEPIPSNVAIKDKAWLVAEAAQPAINRVMLDAPIIIEGNSIQGPNFDLCLDETARLQTDFKSYNQVLGTDPDTQSTILNSYSSSADGIQLNIDYSVLTNFVHFSSAEQRINNFIYKLQVIGQYDRSAQEIEYSDFATSDVYIYEYTGSRGTPYNKKYQKKWVDKKVKLINEFDDFEKWLYFESGSDSKYITLSGSKGGGERDWTRSVITPFPKLSGSYKNARWKEDYLEWDSDELFDWAVHSIFLPGASYELLDVRNTKALNWRKSAIASASAFDSQNNNLLRKTVPQYLSDRGKHDNETYLRFLDLVAQSHDVSWTYTKYFTEINNRLHNTNFENKQGISDDLVYHVGKSYGIDLITGDPNQELWEYKLGKTENGFSIQSSPTASIRTMTAQQRTAETWKRIVNNLPLLLKSKGTITGVRSLINCYGIPEDILPIHEYGSSKKSEQTTLYKEPNFKYCLNFNQQQAVDTFWGPHHKTAGWVTSSNVTPNAVEVRVWPEPTVGTHTQSIWQVNNELGITLHRSHSNAIHEGRLEGFTNFGHFSMILSSSEGYVSASTGKARIFESTNNKQIGHGWWTVLLNRHANKNSHPLGSYHTGSNFKYELTALRGDYEVIDQSVSCSLTVTGSDAYYSSSINKSWSGSLEPGKRAYLGGFVTSSITSAYVHHQQHGAFGIPFSGSMQELRYYATPLSQSALIDHTLATEVYSSNGPTDSYNNLLLRLRLSDKGNHYSGSAAKETSSKTIMSVQPDQRTKYTYWDSSQEYSVSGSTINYPDSLPYDFTEEYYLINTPELGPNSYTSNKVRTEENKLLRHLSAEGRAEKPSSDKYALDSNNLGIYFSPTDQINKDIFDHIGRAPLDNFIGDPKQAYESEYIDLFNFNNTYWKKYNRTINQMTYLNELKLYDMSLFTMLKRLIPARANADLGVVIEPHFIERSKISPPGRISISGDGSPAPIARTTAQVAQVQQLTSPLVNKPRVTQLGYQLPPQVLVAKIGKPQKKPFKINIKQVSPLNSVMKSFSAVTQQSTQLAKQEFTQNTTTIDGVIGSSNSPIITLSNKSAKSLGKNSLEYQAAKERENQRTTSTVPSHILFSHSSYVSPTNGSSAEPINGSLRVTNQVSGSQYSFTSLRKSSSLSSTGYNTATGTYIKVKTPGYISSASFLHICDYRKSEFRKTTKYFYKGNGSVLDTMKSASLGKAFEDGRSFNKYAYSHSLVYAGVSDYNLGGTTGTDRTRHAGTQITAPDFNIDSTETPDRGPVVSFTIGDPNQIITSDPSFRGNLTIE
jgi:hypothetical protein|tara:strand:- start:16948 stop:21453 length:4506 start_codon:yes stop_codon:yes gene_type:complete